VRQSDQPVSGHTINRGRWLSPTLFGKWQNQLDRGEWQTHWTRRGFSHVSCKPFWPDVLGVQFFADLIGNAALGAAGRLPKLDASHCYPRGDHSKPRWSCRNSSAERVAATAPGGGWLWCSNPGIEWRNLILNQGWITFLYFLGVAIKYYQCTDIRTIM